MNIILVIIDTLRYDFVSANGNDAIDTPNLDHLASESVAFDRAFAASYPTIPFRTDVITGRTGSPFHIWKPLPHSDWTFVESLKEAGYATQLIHDTPHLVNGGHNFDWPFHTWTFIRGAEVDRAWIDDEVTWLPNWKRSPLFDCLNGDSSPNFGSYARTNRGRRRDGDWNCAKLFEEAARFLSDNQRRTNFFLWIDCFDPHEPWDAPARFVRRYDPRPNADGTTDPRQFFCDRNDPELSEEARNVIACQYSAKVSWMDHCFGQFLDAFYDTGLAENTTLIVVGDHGTNVGEYGRFGKSAPVRDLEAHIPLFIRQPGESVSRSSDFVQPQDLTATILSIADAEISEQVTGRNILSDTDKRRCAVAGLTASNWGNHFFSVFDQDYWMEWHPDPDQSILRPYRSENDISESNSDRVKELHALGQAEIESRDAHPNLLSWLDQGAECDPPANTPLYQGWPGLDGFDHYFKRTYAGD